MYGVSGIPHAQFGGTESIIGGGTDMYPYYLQVYNQLVDTNSPMSLDVIMNTNSTGGVDIDVSIELTGDITVSDNKLIFILTYDYGGANYFCTVTRYYDENFTLTSAGETGDFNYSFDLDNSWDLSKIKGVVIIQTFSGNLVIHQAGMTELTPDASFTGIVTDAFNSEPIEGATVTAGSFETTTGSSGTYTLEVIAGTYELTCSAEGYYDKTVEAVAITDDITEVNFALNAMLLPPLFLEANVDSGNVTLSWSIPAIPTADLEIVIQTDNYPSETSWDPVNEYGDFIAGINPGDLPSSNTLYSWELEIELGTYTFTIYDTYGDGICCSYGQGYYSLLLNGTEIANGGEFAYSESVTFTADEPTMRDLLGYNVWQDDNETPVNGEILITDLFYTVTGLINGTYTFAVSAVYTSGESPHSDPVEVEVTDATIEMAMSHFGGWNMVGLPVIVEDTGYLTLFPDAIEGTLYSYDAGYVQEDALNTGTGYWLRFPDVGSNIITGYGLNEVTIGLSEGWNMIAGISSTVQVSDINDPSDVIIPNTYYTYDEGYILSTTIEPGKGYWLRASGDGEITISTEVMAARETFVDHLKGANSLKFFNGSGKSNILYFGVTVPEKERLSYSLPPVPPAGFDVRFASDLRFAEESGEIEVMNNTESLIISYAVTMEAGEHKEWVLQSENGEEYVMEGEGEIVVESLVDRFTLGKIEIIPNTYALHQNYPNPFNPVTAIQFDLPDDSFVTLRVYNLLGQQVAQLVNEERPAGVYEITFDACDLASGIYYYQLTSGNTSLVRKMSVIK